MAVVVTALNRGEPITLHRYLLTSLQWSREGFGQYRWPNGVRGKPESGSGVAGVDSPSAKLGGNAASWISGMEFKFHAQWVIGGPVAAG